MQGKPTYGLVGRGRLATHLARYLELENQPVQTWHRGRQETPKEALSAADVLLLAIRDDALQPFVLEHQELRDRPLVHFSGSLVIEGAVGLHPLMTFGPELYDLETYRSIPFIEERGRARFRDVFPGLSNPSWPLDPGLKPLYHALCVMAGNFPALLWSRLMDDFEERLALPRETLRPYLERTIDNVARAGSEAITGPFVRGDRETLQRILRALEGGRYEGIYRAFAELFAHEEVSA